MRVFNVIVVCIALFGLASFATVLSYARFAEEARGTPSFALPVAKSDTLLDRVVAPMLAEHPNQSGLALISSNLQAFATRALAARSAERSLDLQYYYWKDDLTGGLLARELIRAADRGVRVRVVLDDINTKGDDSTYLALNSHPNIEIRLFNPSFSRSNALRRGIEMALRAFSATRRMHNKAWIADGRIAIVGGRNIGDAYFDASETANFRDMDLLLMGAAVPQAETVFDEYWNSSAVLPIEGLTRSRGGDLANTREYLESLFSREAAQPYLQRLQEEQSTEFLLSGNIKIHWTDTARIVSDPAEKANGAGRDGWLLNAILPVLSSAKSRLQITSPYFIPGVQGVSALQKLVNSGVEVSVLTNSLAATDVVAVHGAYSKYRRSLLEGGIQLYELRPEILHQQVTVFGSSGASLHTKAFTVDGRWGFIGSFNFDPRSISLNTEMGVLFDDPGLTAEVDKVFADHITPESSFRLLLERGDVVWEDGERRLKTEPEASIWRRAVAAFIGLMPIESQL